MITDGDLENYDITTVPQGTLDIVEADSFWGVSKLLDGIQVLSLNSFFETLG